MLALAIYFSNSSYPLKEPCKDPPFMRLSSWDELQCEFLPLAIKWRSIQFTQYAATISSSLYLCFKARYEIKKKLFNEISTDWLTTQLTDAFRLAQFDNGWGYGLNFFHCFVIASAREVPFGILQYIQCILHGPLLYPIHLCWQQFISLIKIFWGWV